MTQPSTSTLRRRRIAAARRHPLRPFASHTPVLIVPGLRDSGPGHWQTAWHEAFPDFLRVVPSDVHTADLDAWARDVARASASGPPPIVVAHSFGCLATVRAAQAFGCALAGALLVAPADPDRFAVDGFLPKHRLPFPTTLVASLDDPWLKLVKAGVLASRWGSRLEVAGAIGHINAESGIGPWSAGVDLLRDLAEHAAAAGTVAPRVRKAA